jgi:hypothetical protein
VGARTASTPKTPHKLGLATLPAASDEKLAMCQRIFAAKDGEQPPKTWAELTRIPTKTRAGSAPGATPTSGVSFSMQGGWPRRPALLQRLVPIMDPAGHHRSARLHRSVERIRVRDHVHHLQHQTHGPVAIGMLQGASQFDLPWGSIMAASVMVVLPIVILVLIFQKRIVSGLTSGVVKG